MGKLKDVSSSSFSTDVIDSKELVLVDFWAEWCGPCKALGPILEEVASEVTGKASIVKVNVDNNPDLAQKYGIRGIPTLLFFKNGNVQSTLVGNQPKAEILKTISELT